MLSQRISKSSDGSICPKKITGLGIQKRSQKTDYNSLNKKEYAKEHIETAAFRNLSQKNLPGPFHCCVVKVLVHGVQKSLNFMSQHLGFSRQTCVLFFFLLSFPYPLFEPKIRLYRYEPGDELPVFSLYQRKVPEFDQIRKNLEVNADDIVGQNEFQGAGKSA